MLLQRIKRFSFLFAPLALFLTACPQTSTPTPQPPVTPPADPTVFPVSEISGSIPNWTAGEAYATVASGYSESSTDAGDEIDISPPTFQGTLSTNGTFVVPLQKPEDAALVPLVCDGETYQLGFISLMVVSSTPQPAQGSEVLGVYTLGPTDSPIQNTVWLYSASDLELNTTCTLPGSSPVATKLKLVPGWNQAVLTLNPDARLESGSVPKSFVWSQF